MKKGAILTAIILFTIGSLYALIRYISMQGFAFAWALNCLLMFSGLLFFEALKSPLNGSYFKEQPWEGKGKIYESVGVNLFRKLLVLIGWEKLIRKGNPVEKNIKTLKHLHHQTKQSELSHLILLIIVFGFNIFVALKFGFLASIWLLILNILMHLYPIFLQRYNRPRIERAINVSQWRSASQ
ncbi:hypothetical protein GJU39_03500 [Pedobacter petrophilus]|uniref:Glycosyl-4,4'-diaponeurosporenoate acyltransferase n=1 Tax=Pedobacter petrophilus TaxID=1908241 RepID=A0A7K0FVN5_9SPHI|nr:hypothetical protein [Pedobacter petrophilus]MRX75144.1 hypothetical protein [Pedobacter petrophilus]